MTAAPPEPPGRPAPKRSWWRRRWATVGELVAIAALAVAVLGYLDSHRQRVAEQAALNRTAGVEAARAALVLTARAANDGSRLELSTLRGGQAVQSQRYRFPASVLDHEMEVSAAEPQIDRGWIADGLVHALKAGGHRAEGEGALPVGIETQYIEDGQVRTDRSLYEIGYRVERAGLFGGARVRLLGLSLLRRGLTGNLSSAVDARWKATAPPVAPAAG